MVMVLGYSQHRPLIQMINTVYYISSDFVCTGSGVGKGKGEGKGED